MAIHIGEIIHGLVAERGLKAKAVAEFINISESTLFKIYRKSSVDVDKLIRFSQLLNTNLFAPYMKEEPLNSIFGKQVKLLQLRVAELENELDRKEEGIKSLNEMITMQKKIIALHEDRSREVK